MGTSGTALNISNDYTVSRFLNNEIKFTEGALDNAVVIIDKEIDQLEMSRIKDLFGIEDEIINAPSSACPDIV